ncbi:MAG: gliding motility protein GldB-related protein [Bacteroidia bacterium]
MVRYHRRNIFHRVVFAQVLGTLVSCQAPLPPAQPIQLIRGEILLREFAQKRDTTILKPLVPFVYDCLYVGDTSVPRTVVYEDLQMLATDSALQWLIDTVLKVYPPQYDWNASIGELWRWWKYYFPADTMPTVVTFVGGYPPIGAFTLEKDQAYLGKKYLMLGLHYFLGDTFAYYPVDLPYYIRRRCTAPHLPIYVGLRLVQSRMPKLHPTTLPRLVEYIIHQGIQMYTLAQVLPSLPDTLRFFYTQSHMTWLQSHLAQAYREMLPLLYEANYLKIQRFVGEEPFTKGLGQESPPRLAAYIGYQIVQKYMQKNPHITLPDLLATPIQKYEKLLRETHYQP